MTAPESDLAAVADATAQLLDTAAGLGPAELAAPSLLPNWSRGHVLAHLSRNADALTRVLAGQPMYPDEEARNTDIERDAPRPPTAQLDDLRTSSERFLTAARALDEQRWAEVVALRNGVTDLASSLPFRRWVEVELHHIDLGAGRTVAELPGAFLDRALRYLADRFAGNPALPPIELRAEDGRHWRTGGAEGESRTVAGTPAALVGWLSGRTPGSGLTSAEPLPELPPL
ncbi:maleylpyruvate isomerase family mycothiol-dependent enzyme [Streptomyces profundus]|uniref:maleylpyruvate isomerase family mycothiol-dependent enzyme n=1 Tax=Streptomyces profundus TaxID=2867410 RepID=UPI001D165F77|nr:maleylpyruvate isomerase family mycothiol-dependent enzyme [Streptomyces sp. MA3_2.13]UED83573.1 maleylpyruvate isomerase family mycothiol-dependent enzyme [Streptomyces sp. MA3_2.13]